MKRWRVPLVLAAACMLLGWLVSESVARPGGGSSYSGGGGHGGGSSGSGDGAGELVFLLIRLIIYYPQIGIPIAIIVLVAYIYAQRQNRGLTDWDSGPPVHLAPSVDTDDIRRFDPDFSPVLFEDFVYRLYAQAHEARTTPTGLAALAPYLSDQARQQLAARAPQGVPVSNVIVGAMRVTGLSVPNQPQTPEGHVNYIHLTLEFESNITAGEAGSKRTAYTVERWTMARAANVLSKPPGAVTRFPCPNCGAPFESTDNQQCSYCDEIVANGRFDWLVTGTAVMHEKDGPPLLTSSVPERGTDLPTYSHHAVNHRWGELKQVDPGLTDESLAARVHEIYDALNEGWTNLDLSAARPYVSDGMFDYLQYWINAYNTQGLRNVLENMRLTNWAFAKITRDKYFDAITLRLWGTGRDYTVDAESGRHRSGSKTMDRPYSEYWTLIRSSKTRWQERPEKACPSCGAPLEISMAGSCEHCQTHITSGEFDWVLSKIEQDDSYRG